MTAQIEAVDFFAFDNTGSSRGFGPLPSPRPV